MSITDMNYLQAVSSVSALARDNQQLERHVEQLTTGAARQATTIRQLNEQLSAKETEVQVEQYNVEFVKQQARKSRVINREKIKGFKAKVAELTNEIGNVIPRLRADVERFCQMFVQSEEARRTSDEGIRIRDMQLRTLKREVDCLRQGKPAPMPEVVFMTPDQVARCRRIEEPNDFAMRVQSVQIDQLSMRMQFLDEHKGDLRVAEAIAKQAARAMALKLEDKIIETLMGKPMTRDERHRAEYEMRMKQQRQMYRDGWPVL